VDVLASGEAYSGVTNGGAAVSASNIQQYMDSLAVQLIRGTDKPDLIVADNTTTSSTSSRCSPSSASDSGFAWPAPASPR
jgi:hypothetical protein